MGVVSFSGLASGIDGDAIIKAITDSRRLANKPLENKVTRNDNETKALEEFNTKLLSLNDVIKDFRTLTGGAVTKKAVSSNENAISAIVGTGAAAGTTTLEVLNLARGGTLSFPDRFASIDSPIAPGLSTPGQLEITVGFGADQKVIQISIDSNTTLSQLANKLNEGGQSGFTASTINAGTSANPEYMLVISSSETGVAKGSISVNVSPELTAEGLFQSPNITQAQDALINITGIGQITRSGNQITDILPGVTLDLKSAGTGPVTVSVSNDSSKTSQKLADVIAALNSIIKYSNENDLVERLDSGSNVTNAYGSLARTRVDDQAIGSLKRALAESKSGVANSAIQVFADLGVTTARDGTLSFDEKKFSEAIAKDHNSVNNILQSFADKIGTTNGVIDQYTKFDGFIDNAIDANNQENKTINEKLQRLEQTLAKQTETMKKTFASLESQMSRLNSEGEALNSILSSLPSARRK